MSQRSDPVVAWVDGVIDEAALNLAVWEARARGASLLVVHAGQRDASSIAGFVRDRCAGLSVEVYPALDAVTQTVSSLAAEGRLLVVGRAGAEHSRSRSHGPLALIEAWPGPVLVAPDPRHAAVGELAPVVTGVAAATGADHVVEFAMVEAAMRGRPMRALHIRPPAWADGGRGGLSARSGGHAEAEELLDQALTVWSEKFPEVNVDPFVHVGIDPVIALAAASHSAAIVVVGRGPVRATALASTPYALLGRAASAVAIVPA